jgi:hypothetical protein
VDIPKIIRIFKGRDSKIELKSVSPLDIQTNSLFHACIFLPVVNRRNFA